MILQSKYTLYIFIVITIVLSLIPRNISKQENSIIGKVKTITSNGNKISLAVNHTLANYYVDSIEERDSFLSSIELGDTVGIEGISKLPKDNTNFNLFNYRLYLRSKKIYYVLTISDIDISHDNNLIYKVKNYINNRITNKYIRTFILGDTSSIEDDIFTSYQVNGISHLLALSGMHVSLFSTVILFLLNKIKKKDYSLLVALLLFFYAFLANNTPSLLRCCFLFLFKFFNKKFKFNIKNKYILLYIACFFIIYNPYFIYNVGFLYSFIVSYFIIAYSQTINRCKHYYTSLLMTSFIAFLVSLPITINNFFSINLLSVMINLIFVPLISFIVFPLSLLTFICPFLENILNVVVSIMEEISLFLANNSFNITLCHMPWYGVIIYYIIIIYILKKLKRRKYKYIIIIYIVLLIHTNLYNLEDEVHMLDVGQGDSTLIRLKHNKANILIDTGGIVSYNTSALKKEYSLGINLTIPYLKSLGIKKLDYLVLTHGDYDHAGEAINLINNFKVDKVILNCGDYNDLEKEIIGVLKLKKIEYYNCINELNINDDKLLFLNTFKYDNENSNSIVIYTELSNYKLLFMGDAGIDVENDLLKKYTIKDIDILKVGHHGSKTSSSLSFIDTINPKYSLISVGQNNKYGHPDKETLDTLKESQIYRTDINGSIKIKLNKKRYKVKTCLP